MLRNLDFSEQDSTQYGQDSNDKFVCIKLVIKVEGSYSEESHVFMKYNSYKPLLKQKMG